MFTLTFQFSKKIEIFFENSPTYSFGNSKFFFGYPLHHNLEEIDKDNIEEELSRIKGYFFYVNYSENNLTMANDILGGYRVYKYETKDKIIYTDNYNVLFKKLNKLTINENEYSYWEDHGYTTGSSTFIKNIDKVPPATLITYTEYEKQICYFKNFKNIPNSRKHTDSCYNDLCDSFDLLKKQNKKVILFFSGGKDSVLLALLLKKKEIDFIAVFIRSNPIYKEAYYDFKKAEFIAKKLFIDFTVIDINIDKFDSINEFLKQKMLFDRHFTIVHYNGIKAVKDKFGKDIIIINGQSSDSILSFGASEKTIGYFCRRLLIDYNNRIFRFLLSPLFSHRLNKKFSSGEKDFNYNLEFYDNEDYIVLQRKIQKQNKSFLEDIITKIKKYDMDIMSYRMYLKIHSFLQGSDNQVVINTAIHHDIPQLFMPYSTPSFIYSTVKYKSRIKELFFPKYSISEILNYKLNFKYPILKKIEIPKDIPNAKSIDLSVRNNFRIIISKIISTTIN